mmetsp:Transcript_106784/g.344552  ORF Transcript_106784/g.344552 Transcript_106784/m.344552 type:complete len:327 (-) Transcript_106784:339-1319(-)
MSEHLLPEYDMPPLDADGFYAAEVFPPPPPLGPDSASFGDASLPPLEYAEAAYTEGAAASALPLQQPDFAVQHGLSQPLPRQPAGPLVLIPLCRKGERGGIERHLQNGSGSVHEVDVEGNTPLHVAVEAPKKRDRDGPVPSGVRRQHQRGELLGRCSAPLRMLAKEQLPRHRQHLARERSCYRLPDLGRQDAAALRLRAAADRARGGLVPLRRGREHPRRRGQHGHPLEPREARGPRHGEAPDHRAAALVPGLVPSSEPGGPDADSPGLPRRLHPLRPAAGRAEGRRQLSHQPGRDRPPPGRSAQPRRGHSVAFAVPPIDDGLGGH